MDTYSLNVSLLTPVYHDKNGCRNGPMNTGRLARGFPVPGLFSTKSALEMAYNDNEKLYEMIYFMLAFLFTIYVQSISKEL